MAVLLHISKSSILHILNGQTHDHAIDLEISAETLQRAFELITVLKKQFGFYKGIYFVYLYFRKILNLFRSY